MSKKIQLPRFEKGRRAGVREGVDIPPEKEYPAFSLRYLDAHSKYCLTLCDKEEKASFAEKIRILCQLSWAEIACSDRHGHGYETIPHHQIKRPLPRHLTPDIRIIAFRFQGKKVMVGYRFENVFYVIWFDRDFTLYSH